MTSVITDPDQSEVDDGSVEFGLVELDLLATHAGAPLPYPLRVPPFGRIHGEREVLLAVAGQTLRARGLADGHGPVDAAAELVTALREYRGTVDLVLVDQEGARGVAAIAYRSWALLCQRTLTDDPASTVRIRRVADTALASELLDLVPDVAPATSLPITLPARAISIGKTLIDEVADGTELEQRLRDLVRDHGGDAAVLDQLAGLLPTLTGRGQLGAARRAGEGNVRAGAELSWLDSPRGRVRLNHTEDGWVSVNPLTRTAMKSVLNGLSAIARKPQ
jgi:hypothetical protein